MSERLAWLRVGGGLLALWLSSPLIVGCPQSEPVSPIDTVVADFDLSDLDLSGLDDDLRLGLRDRWQTIRELEEKGADRTFQAEAWADLARLAHAFELWNLATTAYGRAEALSIEESAPWAYLGGCALERAGDLSSAEAAHHRALADPELASPARVGLARISLARGQAQEALAWLETVSSNAATEALRAEAWGQLGDWSRAAAAYDRALELDPSAGGLRYARAGALERLGRSQEAASDRQIEDRRLPAWRDRWLSEVLDLRFGFALPRLFSAAAAAERRDWERAVPELRALLEASPDELEARHHLAISLGRLGRLDEALQELGALVEASPLDARYQFDYGSWLGVAGRLELSVEALERAVTLSPDFVEAHFNLGIALARLERWKEAELHFARAFELDPRNPRLAHLGLSVAREIGDPLLVERWNGSVSSLDAP